MFKIKYDIELNSVFVKYNNNNYALENINLNIESKDFLGIIGPNGAGKSTLLRILLELIQPNAGNIVKRKGLRTGYVPQYASFDRHFPVRVFDVVMMGYLTGKVKFFYSSARKNIKKAEDIMKELRIWELRYRQIGSLSGGQLQKVLIARSLLANPDLLVLDEPTSGIDSKSSSDIYNHLKELNQKMTIVLVSHNIAIVSSYVKTIACLNRKLYYHGKDVKLTSDRIEKIYGCPIELITHGEVPHRVLSKHREVGNA